MEPRLILKVVTDSSSRSKKLDEGASYDSMRGSQRQLLNDRSQKNFAVREYNDERSQGRIPEIEREFKKFKQKLTIKPVADENVQVLQPRTSNNRSRNDLGKIYSKEKYHADKDEPHEDSSRQLLLKDKHIAKLEAEIYQLNDRVRELQNLNGKLSQNLDVLQKTIQFGYGELESKNDLLTKLTEAMTVCGIPAKCEPTSLKESIDKFVEGYRERDKFVSLCSEMVQSVIPQARSEGRPAIKKCWKLLKGMVEDYYRLHHELTDLDSAKREFECQTTSELSAFVRMLASKVKSASGLQEDCSVRLLKYSLEDRPTYSTRTKKVLRNHLN